MLLPDLYSVIHSSHEQATLTATLKINAQHRIFEGHFPGQPVVPGVCMMQMIKELLEEQNRLSLFLSSADHLKFLTVWDPHQHPQLQAEIKSEPAGDGWKVTASLYQGDVVFFKMKGHFLKAA